MAALQHFRLPQSSDGSAIQLTTVSNRGGQEGELGPVSGRQDCRSALLLWRQAAQHTWLYGAAVSVCRRRWRAVIGSL